MLKNEVTSFLESIILFQTFLSYPLSTSFSYPFG